MKGKKLLDIAFSTLLDLEAELVRHFLPLCVVSMLCTHAYSQRARMAAHF